MSAKTCGTILLLAFVASLCVLALGNAPKPWCHAGTVESLFTDCERIATR